MNKDTGHVSPSSIGGGKGMTHIDEKNMICQECGMIVHSKEFHPYEFCILHKAGQDPRDLYNRIVEHIQSEEE